MAVAVWPALTHPLLALGAGLLALVIAVTLTVWIGRRAFGALGRLRRGLSRTVAGRRGEA